MASPDTICCICATRCTCTACHTTEDVAQVTSIFKTADPITGVAKSHTAQCGLKQLQASLLMHGFAYKAVSALVDRARGKAEAGVIDSEAFMQILHAFKREHAHQVEPPSGLDNSIHVLVIHAGFASNVLPVLHCLGERVFPRLAHAAMQLGGLARFEHVTLSDDSYHGLVPQGGQGMTIQAVLAYAAACAASSAHVWFQFVLDESVAASMLPVSVSTNAFENLVARAQKQDEDANDSDACSFGRVLKAIYTKSARRNEYELSADKRQARAAKRLLTQLLAYVYQPKSALASDLRKLPPPVTFAAGTCKDAGARAQRVKRGGGVRFRCEKRIAPLSRDLQASDLAVAWQQGAPKKVPKKAPKPFVPRSLISCNQILPWRV